MSKLLPLSAGAVLACGLLLLASSSIPAPQANLWHRPEAGVHVPAPVQAPAQVPEPEPVQKPEQVPEPEPEQVPEPAAGRLILDESFDGNSLDPRIWNTCHWWQEEGCTIASNDELEWYLPEQVRLEGGALQLIAQERDVRGSDGKAYQFASGMVTTGPPDHEEPANLAFTYGQVEVRFKIPEGAGLWPAIWLLPASEESRPEIDMLEVLGHDTGRLRMRLHPEDRSLPSLREDYALPPGYSLAGQWRTVALDWAPGALRMYLDGRLVWSLESELVPDEPMYLVLNLAVGGHYPGPPDSATQFPAVFAIDHVWIRAHE